MAVNLDFENKLWEMADKLRSNIQPSDYKDVVLGLIFLKYISDSFEEKFNQLVAEGDGFEEDRDAYIEDNVFFVPPGARWDHISCQVFLDNCCLLKLPLFKAIVNMQADVLLCRLQQLRHLILVQPDRLVFQVHIYCSGHCAGGGIPGAGGLWGRDPGGAAEGSPGPH